MLSRAPELIGRYQVVRQLKSGGMGTVFLARDPRIGRHMGGRFVAIKVLQEFDDQDLRARFEREADIAGTLDHRNIVQIYDRDEYDGRPFIVMEYVDGRTLGELIDTGAVSLVRRLQWMEDLCDGLACAHKAGVVHRDIKPANVMIRTQDGVLKILDFGIARSNMIKGNMTRGILGTLNYMAPEQWTDTGSVDLRADVFASGAVFYELLSAKKAFPAVDIPSIYRQISSLAPEPLERRQTDLDPELIAVVNRCLEKNPADRYPDMDAVGARLAAIRRRLAADAASTTIIRLPTFVAEAQQAMDRGDFVVALNACERALAIEPDNTAARSLEARVRAAIQMQTWLANAHGEFERGALTAAEDLVELVLGVNESHPEALSLRQEIDVVRRSIARERQIDAALTRAHERLEAGALEEAASAVVELLNLDPGLEEGKALRQRVDAAIAERRIAEQHERARQTVADARRRFDAGLHRDAITLLQQYQPPHQVVTAALAELRAGYEEMEQQRKEVERRRQEAEQKRQAEERRAAAENERALQVVADARRLFAAGDHAAALKLLETHRPTRADVTDALDAMRAEVLEIARQRVEAAARKKEEEDRQRVEQERRRAQEEERQRLEAARRQQELDAEHRRQEEARLESERRQREQQRLEEVRRRQQQEEAQLREQQRLDDERRSQQEQERLRKQEEQRRTEARKRADEDQRRQTAAAAAAAASVPAAPVVADEDFAKTVVQPSFESEPTIVATPSAAAPKSDVATPSTAAPKSDQRRRLDPRFVAAAAVIVVGVAIGGVIKWRSGPSDGSTTISPTVTNNGSDPAAPSPPPANAPANTPIPSPVVPAAPSNPVAETPAPATPGTGVTVGVDAQLDKLRRTARQQWAGNQRNQAMTTLASAEKLKPRDAGVTALTREFIADMAARAAKAAMAARDAGAAVTTVDFAEGLKRQQEALRLDRTGKPQESVRAYAEAIDLFESARRSTRTGARPPGVVESPAGDPDAGRVRDQPERASGARNTATRGSGARLTTPSGQ